MRATSYDSDQKTRNSVEEAQVRGDKMHVAKDVNSRPSFMVDVEKGEVYQTEAPALVETLIAHEVDDQEESHSKPLIVSEKVIVTLLVVCFVVVEAYFVGVSFRDWLDQQKHANSTSVLLPNHVELVVPQFSQVYRTGPDDGGQEEVTEDSEPFEDFEGGLTFKATRVFFDDLRHKRRSSERDSFERSTPEKGELIFEDTVTRELSDF